MTHSIDLLLACEEIPGASSVWSGINNPYPQFLISYSLFLIPHSSFLIHHPLFPIPYSLYLIYHSLFLIPFSLIFSKVYRRYLALGLTSFVSTCVSVFLSQRPSLLLDSLLQEGYQHVSCVMHDA